MRPSPGSYPNYFDTYIQKVAEDSVIKALQNNATELLSFFSAIPPAAENYAYAPGKWSIKQVLNHITDTERIFAYRALRFARKDPQLVAAFDEDAYAKAADLSARDLQDLLQELMAVRGSNIMLFKSFSAQNLQCSGMMASGPCTVLALGYMICGHANHHVGVIREKYLKDF